MDLFQMLSVALSLILIIVFFYMASNISRIRKELYAISRTEQLMVTYYAQLSLGNISAAYEALAMLVYTEIIGVGEDSALRKQKANELKQLYGAKFNAVGRDFPQWPIAIPT